MLREEFKLRPIEERDLEMVLSWRNTERVRSYMYTDHLITFEEHLAWFERSRLAEFSTTMVFEYHGNPVGLKSFSQINRRNNSCYWGFYLGETELPRGCGTIMGFLALEYIFEECSFRKLCAEAFAFNEGSCRYHTRLGFVREGLFVKHVFKNGCYQDIVSFAMFRDDWMAAKSVLAASIFNDGGTR